MTDAYPAIVVRLVKDDVLKMYRLEYADAIGAWYYVSSMIDGRIEKLPSLHDAIVKRANLDDDVAEMIRHGWTRIEVPVT